MTYSYPVYPPYQYKTPNNISKCPSKINVTGKGIIKVQPDIAVITIGVITENKNLREAEEDNSYTVNKIINVLEQLGIKEKDIKTENFNVEMQYDYVDGKQIFKGYKVTNNLRVTIRNLNSIGEVINASVLNGANNISNISFNLSNPNFVYREAMKLACKDAKVKAEEIARTFGVSIYDVPCSIEEENYNYAPINENISLKAYSTSTPIKSGEIQVSATVKVIFNYNI